MRTLLSRFAGLFQRERRDRALQDEIQSHLDLLAAEYERRGMSPDEARHAARRAFGAVEPMKERYRDRRGLPWIEELSRDIRFSVRHIQRRPGFACTAIVMLALGIGANVAIFGFVDAALIRPLPYEDQSQLVVVFGARQEERTARGNLSYLDYLDARDGSRAFGSIDVYDVRTVSLLATPAGTERVIAPRVSAGFFRTLGVTPILGRDFDSREEGPSGPATVLLGYATWQARFGGRDDVLGQSLTLGGEPHVVIGVLPRDFHFALAGPAEFWLTIRGISVLNSCWERRECRSVQAVARLQDGTSLRTTTLNIDAFMESLADQYPEAGSDRRANLVPLSEVIVGDVRAILLLLLSGAWLLLLIACINVISLLLVRSDARTREIAVRQALGASSARLALQYATESFVLVLFGVAYGLVFAEWTMQALSSFLTPDTVARMPYLQGIGLNVRLLVFAGGVSLIAGVMFTLAPVLRTSVSERFSGLREGSRSSVGTTWRRFGRPLVVAELALALVLLVSAGLLGKSLYQLLHVDTGLNPQHLSTLSVGMRPSDLSEEQRRTFAREVAERVAAVPGVQDVGYADQLPLSPGDAPTRTFRVAGRPDREQLDDPHPVRRVSADYFRALQARLLDGRYFTDVEVASARPVAIVNQTAAQRYFPDEDPIGQSIFFPDEPTPTRQIVGVVADIKDGPLETPARPAVYLPFDQGGGFVLVVRTTLREEALFPSLRAAIRELRPGVSIGAEMTMTERMNQLPSAHLHRSSAWVVGTFAAVAVLLSVVGLYGVVAYSVGQRTREIGVRMALGAQRRSVYRLVLGEAGRLVSIGALIGIACAVAAGRLMRQLLFEVRAWDVPTLLAAAAVLIVAALGACYLAARRATRVDPLVALRVE